MDYIAVARHMDYVAVARHIAKRGLGHVDGNIAYQLPGWAWFVLLADAIVFLPIFLFIGYTLNNVYPALAIVENPNPPAYEPVALNEEPETGAEDSAAASVPAFSKPITSSLRRINRLIYSIGGWKSNFRGLFCLFVLGLANSLLGALFSGIPFVGAAVGTLIASLALVQLSTAWVHIVISPPNEAPFWRRLQPFKKVFEATCFPVLLAWATTTLAQYMPIFLGWALGLPQWKLQDVNNPPEYRQSDLWKSLVVFVVTMVVTVFIVFPTQVLLIRVQASLLPPDEDTVIPFDRSFEGKLEPAIVGGKGCVTVKDAVKTVSRSSWIRLYVLYAKLLAVIFVLFFLMMAVIISEVVLMAKKSTKA